MANLRTVAESDLRFTLEDTDGAGNAYTLIDPDGSEYQVIGTYKNIGYLLDEEDGVPIQGSSVTVTYRMKTLKNQTDQKPDKGWRVRIRDLDDREHIFYVIRYEPDRTIGIARLTLELTLE